jgi:energy-coupling factor transporter ATP-binding protein EcfA2
MPTGPQKIILIGSGRYMYAEVELSGALQIVGPNNTGKTTLINTLQFLYLDDRRNMDFGSYTPEQTRDFYFPSQYSYVLFECLGAQGVCVIGWRGQSKTHGGDPERFCYLGAYEESDFLDEKRQVREPQDVNARLAFKQFKSIRSAQEHRELLLASTGAGTRGLGIVSLRDPDKYPQFRETLKNLLTLNAITQEQMRDRLLMLADIPPDRTALDARELFGEDYDRIRERRERLLRFKKHQGLVERLVEQSTARDLCRGELMYRWTDLRGKRQEFEKEHEKQLVELQETRTRHENRLREMDAELLDRRTDVNRFSEQKGGFQFQLEQLRQLDKEFSDYVPDLERAAIGNLSEAIRLLTNQLADAQGESREKARQKLDFFAEQVRHKEQTIQSFHNVAVTALRKHFTDQELNRLFRLFNRNLLEYPMGPDGIHVVREKEVLGMLQSLLKQLSDDGLQDPALAIRFRGSELPLAGLENIEAVQERLKDDQEKLEYWRNVLRAIEEREKLEQELQARRHELTLKNTRQVRYEEYQKAKANEPRWTSELKAITDGITAAQNRIAKLVKEQTVALRSREEAEDLIRKTEDTFNRVMGSFGLCVFPEFEVGPRVVTDTPDDFDAAIALFLRQQDQQNRASDDIRRILVDVERWFGEEFRGDTEEQTVQRLREELEALAEREEALTRDWNAHLHAIRATFDRILKELGHVYSARDDLNRAFAKVQVSNLKSLRMDVKEQSDLVAWIRSLADAEQPGLFDDDTSLSSTMKNFRHKLEGNPVVRFADLFTLGFTVVGADDRKHSYHDLRQIESHGTTITIKVLFNLLLLKSQLRREDCQVPFFLDEIQILDPANRHAILATARKLGFLAITAAPEAVSEVDALYFLQANKGWIVLRQKHRIGVKGRPAS